MVAQPVDLWSNCRLMVNRGVAPPEFNELRSDLEVLRRAGIAKLTHLTLPGLSQVARSSGHLDLDEKASGPALESVLRAAVVELAGDRLGDCGELLFGLAPGTRGYTPTELRRDAAERWGVSEARFRRAPQESVIEAIASTMLRQAHEHQQRLAYLNLERRLPPTSRLAIAWLERFEAYYGIWSPVFGLARDLAAYRLTLLEPGRPYDIPRDPSNPDGENYTQEDQARGYVHFALWHHTTHLVALHRFQVRYGGLWLLSDQRAEQDAADAIYRVAWHNPNNEEDESYLRTLFERAGGELVNFRQILRTDAVGQAILGEWQEWCDRCQCTWNQPDRSDREHFPTHRHHAGINIKCQMHAVIAAANDYCVLIDDDWHRIADWYRQPTPWTSPIADHAMYEGFRSGLQ